MSRVTEADVVVVGGGVAGATTARLLAEANHRVVVLDKATFPRDKPCGEGVMPTGVRLLSRLGILPNISPEESHPIRGVRFVTRDDATIQGDFPDIGDGFHVGMGVRRTVLDAHVLAHARAHTGVEIHESEPVEDVLFPPSGPAEVVTAEGRYRARLIVGADGVRSLVRHRLGLERPRGRRQRFGIRAHFRPGDPSTIEDYVSVHMHPPGESYVTPVGNDEIEVALLIEKPFMKAFAGNATEELERFVKADPRLRARLSGGTRTSPVLVCGPFDVRVKCRVADRAVLVGDAAGYLDPVTGEGISLALQSAVWAAATIDTALRGDRLSAADLLPYDRRMTRAIRHYALLTRALLVLARRPRAASFLIRRMAHAPALYSKLLAINCGVRTFWDLRPADLRAPRTSGHDPALPSESPPKGADGAALVNPALHP